MLLFLSFGINVNAQLVIVPIDDKQQAYASEQFELDVEHDKVIGVDEVTYSLEASLSGMSINSTTGLITYTPETILDGGKVVVKVEADNDGQPVSDTEMFYVYVTDAVQCPEGAVAYWKLDEAQSETSYEDYIGGNNLQRIETAPKDTTGVVDSAKVFSMTSGLKTTNVDAFNWENTQSFTVEFWMKPNVDADVTEVFIGRNAVSQTEPNQLHWWVGRDPDNKIVFAIRNINNGNANDEVVSSDPYYPGWTGGDQYHHVVAVRDAANNQMKLYIDYDGEQLTLPFTPEDHVLTGDYSLDIGYLNNDPNEDYFYNGAMDEILVYNKALTAAEVQARYNKGVSGDAACSPGNFAPLFISEPVTSVEEDVLYSYAVVADDVEAGNLTYSAPVIPSWLTFNPSSKILTGTPTNENVGDTVVQLAITDGEVEVLQEFDLTVSNVNDAPVITSTVVSSVNEDEAFSYQLEYEDVDLGDVVTLSATDLPSWLTFNTTTGLLSGTPTNENVGTHDFTLAVEDMDGASDELMFSLEVVNINDAPVINGQETLTTDEDVAITVNLTDLQVTDVDNEFPTDFSLTLLEGDNYTFAGNVVSPDLNYHGPLTVPVTLSDGDSIVEYDLNITVEPVNDLPVVTSSPELTVDEEQEYSYVITYTDVDEDVIEVEPATLPDWLTFNDATSALSGTPDDAEVGLHTVELLVMDGTDTVPDAFQITVNAVNDVPSIDGQVSTKTVYADSVVTISVDDFVITDPDNTAEDMSIILESGLNYSLSGNNAIIPASGFNGSIAVSVKVSDGTAVSEEFEYVMDVQVFVDVDNPVITNNLINRIHPNPAQSYVIFELNVNNLEQNAAIEIYSITGNLVKTVYLERNSKVVIDLSELSEGIYLYNLVNGSTFQTGKFVKN